MHIERTALPGVLILQPPRFDDERGWFMETWRAGRFADALRRLGEPVPPPFVQDAHSHSRRGVLRGLHWQLPPHAQGKLMRVVRGAAFDVAVDLRRSSPTFARWVGVELSAANRRQLWIPPGFGHGVLALEEGTEVIYKTTDVHVPERERALRWDDARVAIAWPLPGGQAPTLSARDAAAPALERAEVFAD